MYGEASDKKIQPVLWILRDGEPDRDDKATDLT